MALKKLYIGIFLIFTINCNLALSQNELSVDTLDNPSPGYILLDTYKEGFLTITDNSGFLAMRKSINNFNIAISFIKQKNGLFTYFANQSFYVLNSNFILLDSFAFKNSTGTDSHDFKLTSDGHAFLLGLRYDTVDMSVIVPGGKTNSVLRSSTIQEQDENKNVVWEWLSKDHFQVTDASSEVDLTKQQISWVHANSIEVDYDGNILLSSRNLDEITKINTQTGEIIWRLGGKECKNNQFKYLNDTINGFWGFSQQHSIHRLPNGNITLFDNGGLKPLKYSRAVEYEIDEVNKTIRKVWEYSSSPVVFSTSQGSVQRLPNGNTIIGWGSNSRHLTLTEVRPDGSIAIEARNLESYQVMRCPINMASKLILVQNTGNYDFSDSANKTAVFLDLQNITGSGYVSVERHYYTPHNIAFAGKFPIKSYSHRWVLNNNGISQFSGKIIFKLSEIDSLYSPDKYKIYWRKQEGSGKFSVLGTIYNQIQRTLESNISSFGEFIICEPMDPQTSLLIAPLDSSNINPTTLNLLWNKFNEADSYKIQVSFDKNFTLIKIDSTITSDTTLLLSGLENNRTYFWRIKSIIDTVETDWSFPWSFITIMNTPDLIKPANGETEFQVKGLFEWDSVPGAGLYKINISTDSNFNYIVVNDSGITITRFSPQVALENDKIYFWRVMALNSNNESLWSDTYTFKTVNNNTLSSPMLLSPANDTTEVPLNGYLYWTQDNNASSYKLELSSNPNFFPKKISQIGISSHYYYYSSLDNNTLYYWHVAAANQFDTSSWSDTWHFKTETIKDINEILESEFLVKYTGDGKIIIHGDISEKQSYFTLYDITGRNILNRRIEQNHSMIDCSAYEPGIYFYFININSKCTKGKIIIY